VTLVALASLKGSPGVTTAAVGLAAGWPSGQQPVVVECDPAGGDLWARFRLETAPGLMSLAAAVRHRAGPGLVWEHTQRLPGGLPVIVGPAGTEQARASLAQVTRRGTEVLRWAAGRAGTVVIADCGRLDADSSALKVARDADVLLLLARACDDALAHVAAQWPAVVCWTRRRSLVLVGDGYPEEEIACALDVPVTARLPHDPKGAAGLGGRPGRRAAPARSPLGRALARLAEDTAARAAAVPPDEPTTSLSISPKAGVDDPRTAWR